MKRKCYDLPDTYSVVEVKPSKPSSQEKPKSRLIKKKQVGRRAHKVGEEATSQAASKKQKETTGEIAVQASEAETRIATADAEDEVPAAEASQSMLLSDDVSQIAATENVIQVCMPASMTVSYRFSS